MTKPAKYLPLAALAIAMATACENSQDIGSSIIQDEITVVVDSSFTVTGQSVDNPRIQSRTTTQLLGAINAKEYGTFSSDFVTQFMAAGQIDTKGVSVDDIDSLRLMLSVPKGAYVGDSIAPMGLKVYPLTRQLPSPIYSDFDPTGYYDPQHPIATQIYACNALALPDSLAKLNYRHIYATLPRELGQKLYQAYLDNPASYLEPTSFAQIFPGLYVANSYGSGRVIKIEGTNLQLFYRRHQTLADGRDTTYLRTGYFYSVTPEVVTNNNISLAIAPNLRQMAQQGKTILVAPTGMDIELTFPLPQIIEKFRDNPNSLPIVNTLTFDIPATAIANTYGINPPPSLLLVLKSHRDEFFSKNQVTDNIHSFTANYDSKAQRYQFTGMRDYLTTMLAKAQITPDDYTFTLTPVSVTTESYTTSSSFYISAIVPYIDTPAMAQIHLDKAKIKFIYSKQTLNF